MANIEIYFGEVVEVDSDELKTQRIKVKIQGFTDSIPTEKLAWYYPFFGLFYKPVKTDIVPVFIFDDNFSTGFYNNKVNLVDLGLTTDDYPDYLEIYNRKGVSLLYKLSTGIEFINQKAKIQIEKDKISQFVEDNQITMDKNRIDLGKDGPATILGDKGIEAFKNSIKHTDDLMRSINDLFTKISAVCTNPFTLPIGAQIKANIPLINSKFKSIVSSNNEFLDTIQSKKTFIE